jgi:flagellar biosynthesis component FlhA
MIYLVASILLVLSLVTGQAVFFCVGVLSAVPIGIWMANRQAKQYEKAQEEFLRRMRETRAAYGI